jgi:hypothetical protein
MNGIIRNTCDRKTAAVFMTILSFSIMMLLAMPVFAQSDLVKLSTDTFHNSDSEHKTEVEPDIYSYGSTMVSGFQVARIPDGGGADVGFATSTDGGKTWTSGYLPGLTDNYKGGSFTAASDAAVAYDVKHGLWTIATLPLVDNDGEAVGVSSSTDGIHWNKPVLVDQSGSDDKEWIVCDNTSTSPHYGNCYVEWDEPEEGDLVFMSTSSDGGKTWTAGQNVSVYGLGGQPLVQPNGTVIVPVSELGTLVSFSSTNGGKSWSSPTTIAQQDFHTPAGGLRNGYGMPTAQIDGKGTVYVVWPDCRFRSDCSSNDLVMSTSANGTSWSNVARIPIDPVKSTVDHFIPGIGIDRTTSGSTAHLTVTYYYYPVSNCNSCTLYVGYTSSQDGGKTWTKGTELAGPMQLSWLPQSDNGLMVADYLGAAYSNGNPYGAFAVAKAPKGSSQYNEAIYTTKSPLLPRPGEKFFSSKHDKPVPNAKGTFVWRYYDDDGKYPIPPSKLKNNRK